MKLKEQIIRELNKNEFPDLKFLYSDEVLDISLEVLNDLLKIDKHNFNTLLLIENKDLSFNSFEDDSLLDYFWSLLNHLDSVNSSDKIRKIIEEFRPKLQDFSHEISYSKDYYEQLLYVNENSELDDEEKRIMFLRIKAFKDRWINLDKKHQDKLKKINKKLWKISDQFSNNIIDDEKTFEYAVRDFETIKNLPKEVLDITEKAYKKSSYYSPETPEWHLFDADPTSYGAIMKYCSSQEIRKDFEFSHNNIASKWNFDNREIVLKILKLKKEKSEVLGYKNYAELSLNSKMAESPEQVFTFVEWISKKAREKGELEIKELKDYFCLEQMETYDIAYYSTKYKEEKYDFDEKELKKYFEFENVLNYLHRFVEKFYWIDIKEIKQESYDENIRIYEVYRWKDLISYYFLDPFYRKLKATWASANNLRERTLINTDKIPVVVNLCNFQKAENWKTTLYLRDVETLFHEFWHAMHEILSQSKHSELSGFWVEWDFVELPSQLLENWANTKESLLKLASHVDTWKNIPKKMIETLEQLKTYMTWIFLSRQNELALLDMTLYTIPVPKTIKELDKIFLEIVNKYSIFPRFLDYKMYCSFSHIFAGWYSAGYYSYIWAEIIEADVFARIEEQWMFNPKVWKKFLDTILWQWTRKEAKELFFDFMWREVDNKAFMERYGLV